MGVPNWQNRTLWTRDNLDVLRGMHSETVDLIYLDPPFNSSKIYATPIGGEKAREEFKNTWTLDDLDVAWLGRIAHKAPALYRVIDAAGHTHSGGMQSYLTMMAIRLLEMRRILKPTGSLYLHCDPVASHYLKQLMDSIFGKMNFRDEITWLRAAKRAKGSQHPRRSFGKDFDTIFHYSKKDRYVHHPIYIKLNPEEMEGKFPYVDEDNKRYNTGVPLFSQPSMGARPNLCYEYKGVKNPHPSGWRVSREKLAQMDAERRILWREGKRPLRKSFASEYEGVPMGSLWTDIPNAGPAERVGYRTQKPLALLRRIIEASSNTGDMVLDPFCGCATACVAAEELGRQWVGIDISPKAKELIRKRFAQNLDLFKEALESTVYREDVPDRHDLTQEESREEIEFAMPVPQRRSSSAANKEYLFGKQRGICPGCDDRFAYRSFGFDHIVARTKGGGDELENLQLLCGSCNSMKGTLSMGDFKRRRIRLLKAKLEALEGEEK